MARINFRQGIVRHQTDGVGTPVFLKKVGTDVNLVISPDFTTICFVDGLKDYLFTESLSIDAAWPSIVTGIDSWLYWDLNKVTGVRTFGITNLIPILQTSAPVSPLPTQMWFHTGTNEWFEFNGTSWIHVIRVFAAKLTGGTAFESMSIDAPAFTGTQVGLTTSKNIGSLVFDSTGKPIINQDGKFFTTEDTFTAGVPTGASLKVNNILVRAVAQIPIAAFNVVEFTDFDKITVANPFDTLDSVYGIIDADVTTNDTTNVITEGVIFNDAWDWEADGATVNDPVFIDATGQIVITEDIPNQVPVGAVIGKQEILFKMGIFGYGVASGGVNDHGSLAGLSGDDHFQYHTDARGDARYALTLHNHLKADITDFAHLHTKSEISDFAHNHLKADITDFAHSHLKIDITDFSDADYATAAEGILAVSATQPADNISTLTNDAGYLTTETDPVFLAQKGQFNGVATLDGVGIIPSSQLPPLAITKTFVVANETEQLALTVQEGDVAVRTDESVSYIALNATNATMADWQELLTPTDAVISVDGQTGVVDLTSTYATAAQGATADSALQNITAESITDLGDVFSTMVPSAGDILTFNVINGWQSETPIVGGGNNWLTANAGIDFDNPPNSTPAYGAQNNIALGNGAVATATDESPFGASAIAIGTGAYISTGSSAIAIGTFAYCADRQSLAIGTQAYSIGSNEVVIGPFASTSTPSVDSIVIGGGSNASKIQQTVVGQYLGGGDVPVDVDYSVKIGYAAGGSPTDKNVVHLHSKGKLEVIGAEAQFVLPNYTTAEIAIPLPGVSGGLVYDTDTSELKAYDGAVWNAIINVGDNIDLVAFSESTGSYGTTGAIALDTSVATYFYPTGTTTGSITFSFTNPAVSGRVTSFTLEMLGASNFPPVWPASVKWPGGTEPTWTTGIDVVSFSTRDNGTTWLGMLGGTAFA